MSIHPDIQILLDNTFGKFGGVLEQHDFDPRLIEIGKVTYVGRSHARVSGLPNVQSEELLQFPNHVLGLDLNLDPNEVGVGISGQIVTGKFIDVERPYLPGPKDGDNGNQA